MEFTRTEEQQELATTVRALLAKRADSGAVRAAMASEAGYDESLWQTLCEQIGVAALAVPEEHDGRRGNRRRQLVVGHGADPTAPYLRRAWVRTLR